MDTRPGAARILVDLSHAADGYVGIAQDIRLIFAMLDGIAGYDVAGLLMAVRRHDVPRLAPGMADEMAVASGVLNWMALARKPPGSRGSLGRALHQAGELRHALRASHHAIRLQDQGRSGAVWRVLFQKTLAPDQRARIMLRDFYATDLSVGRIMDRTNILPFLRPKALDAPGFDFALFGMPRPVRMASGVQQLMRYHDAIPVTDADTVETWRVSVTHQRLVRRCDRRAVFVCNSPQSVDDLLAIDPTRAGHTVVIPCALAPLRPDGGPPGGGQPDGGQASFAAIVASRRTFRALGKGSVGGGRPAERGVVPPFILTVSTLEPRKNYVGLIRAWERVVSRHASDLRLVIVANKGWLEQEVLAAMRPHVASGRILHLQGLPIEELQALSRQALGFVFPSFVEGFGYPPLEALQAGTPVLVSDLPVFRWIFGAAALYVDPYDIDAITQGIERLTVLAGAAGLRADLLSHRRAVIDRFQPARIADDWAALLDRLRTRAHAAR